MAVHVSLQCYFSSGIALNLNVVLISLTPCGKLSPVLLVGSWEIPHQGNQRAATKITEHWLQLSTCV